MAICHESGVPWQSQCATSAEEESRSGPGPRSQLAADIRPVLTNAVTKPQHYCGGLQKPNKCFIPVLKSQNQRLNAK